MHDHNNYMYLLCSLPSPAYFDGKLLPLQDLWHIFLHMVVPFSRSIHPKDSKSHLCILLSKGKTKSI